METAEIRRQLGIHAEGKYGLLDRRSNLWLGDNDTPWRCDDYRLALLKAHVTELELGWAELRIAVREFPTEPMRLRDEVSTTPEGVMQARTFLQESQ